jgi:periplasmic divalent cation tolerance protein
MGLFYSQKECFSRMEPMIVYITAKNLQQARSIGKTLVEERLAACANIIDGMQSIYHWEGRLCEDTETVLILKTRRELLERLVVRAGELHSYSCPCIVACPIVGGNGDYIEWIEKETK